jgi:hypothetical protein
VGDTGGDGEGDTVREAMCVELNMTSKRAVI